MKALAMLALLALSGQSGAFNLESRIAIVKDGPEGSYFGYSVAQHQVIRAGTENVKIFSYFFWLEFCQKISLLLGLWCNFYHFSEMTLEEHDLESWQGSLTM